MMQLVLEDVGSPVTLSDGRWPVGDILRFVSSTHDYVDISQTHGLHISTYSYPYTPTRLGIF